MESLSRFAIVLLGCATVALFGGCGSDDSDDSDVESDTSSDSGTGTEEDELEITGDYVDDWGSAHSITAETWTTAMGESSSVAHITAYDNDAGFLVAQNDGTLSYKPNLWSRFDWTYSSDELYYCQIAYDAVDEETAAANTSADRKDLATGCAGFSWSLLTEE